jgi:hypothetical protein
MLANLAVGFANDFSETFHDGLPLNSQRARLARQQLCHRSQIIWNRPRASGE